MSAVIEDVLQTEAKPRVKWRTRIWKYLLYAVLALAAVALAVHLSYTYSGSGKWELVSDRQGVKVYSMKLPGHDLKKFTAVFRVKASLASIMGFMQDSDSDLDVDFYKARELERHGPQMMVTTWRSGFPRPFTDRDFVVRHTFTQDPATKEVYYVLQSLPDMIPPDSCCVRVPTMNNSWQITPLKNGEVEIRWVIDMDIGGAMPYFVINQAHPEIMTDFASKLQGYFDRPKYAHMKYDWLAEPS